MKATDEDLRRGAGIHPISRREGYNWIAQKTIRIGTDSELQRAESFSPVDGPHENKARDPEVRSLHAFGALYQRISFGSLTEVSLSLE